MEYVFDACAMIAYLNGEIGGDVVDRMLRDGRNSCYAHSINLCEARMALPEPHGCEPRARYVSLSIPRVAVGLLAGLGLRPVALAKPDGEQRQHREPT